MRDIRSKRCRATRESAKRASRPAQTRRVPTTDKRLCQECSFTRERERETATVLIIISENELFACRIPDQQQKQKSIRPRIHFFHPHFFSSFPFLPFPSLPFSLLSFLFFLKSVRFLLVAVSWKTFRFGWSRSLDSAAVT